MPEISFYTTYPDNPYLLARAENGSQSGLQRRGCYRFGFNGKEKVDELFESSGSAYDFGARLYDSRLGRWMACDPLAVKYPGYSPYHFGYCDPIAVIDPDGRENIIVVGAQGPASTDGTGMARENNFYGRAVFYARKLKRNGENTTVMLNGNDADDLKRGQAYTDKLLKMGVKVVYYYNEQDIVEYANCRPTTTTTCNDVAYKEQVTDLVFLTHACPSDLLLGGGVHLNESDAEQFDRTAFSPNAVVNIGACNTGNDVASDPGPFNKYGLAQAFAVRVGLKAVGPAAAEGDAAEINGACSYASDDVDAPYTDNGYNVYQPGSSSPEHVGKKTQVFEESVDKQWSQYVIKKDEYDKRLQTEKRDRALNRRANVPMF
ncbi:MAG: hypothetical protein A2W93_09650 [Bacteroidetes bacterium GWF2_43_63]|nr:MAG: hypothetical protein A2W94_07135 [Bacteroidetes bacterium GWE2_42_42]OFY54571.1 MAG: hypothetical protein A2W93_09650 [Bacteroidetes bacterium GWF2_43_63]HBG70619.1 hypothetical protein [Bacteroidales bacterium]HCB60916.1 hypothetical protein [Bacteroidales bacterium]